MRPILLQGHTRPLTRVRYNRDGDLLFTAGKDKTLNVWFSHNGERLGSYDGHKGAINDFGISYNTEFLIAGAADGVALLWDAEHGKILHSWDTKTVVRTVAISDGDEYGLIVADKGMSADAHAIVVPVRPGAEHDAVVSKFFPPAGLGKIMVATWGPMNKHIYTGHGDGWLRMYELDGRIANAVLAHNGEITDMQWSKDKTYFLTTSKDHTGILWDKDLNKLKTYLSDRPVNAGTICPKKEHVILAGGQEASQVTTTGARQGRFESRFFHKIFEIEVGRVGGHFGPVNSIVANPDGKSFTTGGEEGFVRINHFDRDYFSFKVDPAEP